MDDNSGREFWKRIDTELERQGSNLTIFCEAVGVSYGTVSLQRTRHTVPKADLCISMAQELNVSVEYLVRGESKKQPFSPRVMTIAHACEKASELKLQMMEELLGIVPAGKNPAVSQA